LLQKHKKFNSKNSKKSLLKCIKKNTKIKKSQKPDDHKKFWLQRKFVKLQSKWYKKLSKAGFSDLEHFSEFYGASQASPFLRNPIANLRSKFTVSTQIYYQHAQDFAKYGNFPSKLLQYLWQLHSDGVSYRQIIPLIAKKFKRTYSIFWVSQKVNKLKKLMFLYVTQTAAAEEADETLDSFIRSNKSIL
jgi:hypothetical protein